MISRVEDNMTGVLPRDSMYPARPPARPPSSASFLLWLYKLCEANFFIHYTQCHLNTSLSQLGVLWILYVPS